MSRHKPWHLRLRSSTIDWAVCAKKTAMTCLSCFAAFAKRTLRSGESTRVELRLSLRDLAWFDAARMGWRAEAGAYTLQVGASSRDLRLEAAFELVKDSFEPVG